MKLITDESIKDAIKYFHDKISNNKKLKYLIEMLNDEYNIKINHSAENQAYYNNFIYIDPRQIYVGSEIANKLLYKQFHHVNDIRFYIHEEYNSIIIEGGINLHLEMSKPPQIKINNNIKFEYPKYELDDFRRHHQYLHWHQDMTTTAKNLNEVIDILILTMEKLHEL